MNKKLFLLSVLFLLRTVLYAQDKEAEMADTLRSNGKIYNVVAVVLVILTGFFIYLFVTERKLSKLEYRVKK